MPNLSQEELRLLKEKYKDVKLKSGLNEKVDKLIKMESKKTLKEIKKELGIKDEVIANMFGYANAHSYRTSKARDKMDRGLELFYSLVIDKKC